MRRPQAATRGVKLTLGSRNEDFPLRIHMCGSKGNGGILGKLAQQPPGHREEQPPREQTPSTGARRSPIQGCSGRQLSCLRWPESGDPHVRVSPPCHPACPAPACPAALASRPPCLLLSGHCCALKAPPRVCPQVFPQDPSPTGSFNLVLQSKLQKERD